MICSDMWGNSMVASGEILCVLSHDHPVGCAQPGPRAFPEKREPSKRSKEKCKGPRVEACYVCLREGKRTYVRRLYVVGGNPWWQSQDGRDRSLGQQWGKCPR